MISTHAFSHQAMLCDLPPKGQLTYVDLISQVDAIEHQLRFGEVFFVETVFNRQRRMVSFKADAIFCLMQKISKNSEAMVSRLDIVRAIRPGEAYQTLAFVRPGGELLLSVEGSSRATLVLQYLVSIEALAIPLADVAPEYWRHVHNRIAANMKPRLYSRIQHKAWVLRRGV